MTKLKKKKKKIGRGMIFFWGGGKFVKSFFLFLDEIEFFFSAGGFLDVIASLEEHWDVSMSVTQSY